MTSYLTDHLARMRAVLDTSLSGWPLHHYSPATFAQHRAIQPILKNYARGKVIDLGAGNVPYEVDLRMLGTVYHTLDTATRSPSVSLTYIADIQNMDIVPDASYDTAICLEVLEHVARPWAAMGEIARILAPGGTAVISAPHLARIHEAPNDYYRFTAYGISAMADRAGLSVIKMNSRGGLLCFLGHQIASLALVVSWRPKLLRWAVLTLLFVTVTIPCYVCDYVLRDSQVFPLGHVAVLRKRQ